MTGLDGIFYSSNSRERWLDLLQPGYKSASEEPGGAQNVYREVIATTSHGSTEGDEIEVKEGDIMTILTDLPDGWYKCALTDGRAGWVPKKICSELDDPVARQLHLNNFALSKEASRVYAEMKGQDHGTVFQRLRVFFGTDL
uniref:Rho guanine nucleotide exchange factor 19 n=1 Tax=Schistocephalus solidus TaxID=70667 RepID=A0A0V0J4L2_SCHSO